MGLAGAAAAALALAIIWQGGPSNFFGGTETRPAESVAQVDKNQAVPSLPQADPDKKATHELHKGPAKTGVQTWWKSGFASVTHRYGKNSIRLVPHTWIRLKSTSTKAAKFVLHRGSSEFVVQPLAKGESFAVETDHALVEVVGTRFRVTVDNNCTRLRVVRGAVRFTDTSTSKAELVRRGQDRSICRTVETKAKPLSISKGARWMRQAMTLLMEGKDLEKAARILRRYLDRYPRGSFAEEALFHLIFANQRLGNKREAAALSAEFLVRFPDTRRAARVRNWLGR